MTEFLSRDAWAEGRRPRQVVHLNAGVVKGWAAHWPGTTQEVIGDPGREAIAARLRSYYDYHVKTRGWFDIAYQVAIDQAGRVWDLRGINVESAANGSAAANDTYGAILFLLGKSEAPSGAMLQAAVDFHQTRWLKLYPNADQIVGHSDVRPEPTACPGPFLNALIDERKLGRGSVTLPPAAPVRPTPPAPKPEPVFIDLTGKQAGSPVVKLIDLRNAHRRVVRAPGMKALQRLLEVPDDGLGGPLTRKALGNAQRRAGLKVDYVFGPVTASALLAGK